jgi:transglutaminase-like putative cysteine protease
MRGALKEISMHRSSRFVACVLAAACAACSSSDKKDASTTSAGAPTASTGAAAPASTTATEVRRTGKAAAFDVRHEVKIMVPEGAKNVRAWIAYPQDDPLQVVSDMKIESPFPHRVETDAQGNKVLYVEAANPGVKDFTVVESFRLLRREDRTAPDASKTRPLTAEERAKFSAELSPNVNVVINDDVKKLSKEIVAGETNPVKAARKLYDWELQNVDYWVKDPDNRKASPVGSTTYTLEKRTGNCTDFHSLWTSLARAEGIPTRMVYGSFLKAELDGKDKDQSYHCWPEFYAPGIGWVPHDVAVADIFVGDFKTTPANDEKVRLTTADGYKGADPAKVDYYFGNIDERRVTWSRGRDLALQPAPANGPVNMLAKAHVEVDDKTHPEKDGWVRKLTFASVKSATP